MNKAPAVRGLGGEVRLGKPIVHSTGTLLMDEVDLHPRGALLPPEQRQARPAQLDGHLVLDDPAQRAIAEADPARVDAVLADGHERARAVARSTMREVRTAMGLGGAGVKKP